MKKIIILLLCVVFTSCGTSKKLGTVNPLDRESYVDTETEYRDWGMSSSPDESIMRMEATSEALVRLSNKINSQVINAFEEYTKQVKIGDNMEIQKIIENYEKLSSSNNLKDWSVIEEKLIDGKYYISISIDKEEIINESVDKLMSTFSQDIENELIRSRDSFIGRIN